MKRKSLAKLFQDDHAPMKLYGMEDLRFFEAVLRSCPQGACITFDHSESEMFVQRFASWAHRDNPDDFEADYYRIDQSFIEEISKAIEDGDLELDHHLQITDAAGRELFRAVDDFYDIVIDKELESCLLEQR